MQLGYILIYVTNVKETVAFYEAAFDLETAFLHESEVYAEMETGATRLGFVAIDLAQEHADFELITHAKKPPGIELAFVTEDLPAAYDKALQAGATAVLAPRKKPWGQWVSYVRDLNGCLIEICTPMSGN